MQGLPAASRKVVYLTGTRADFGLMQSTLQRLTQVLNLGVAVTGMHLDACYGHTVDEIHATGLRVCGEIPIDVATRTPQSMAAAVGACLERGASGAPACPSRFESMNEKDSRTTLSLLCF